ncbi:MAG: LEA type 2 family protein [Ignavibacteria bacterium]|jgi:LEA14-like dessication related protein|nr:LEA type 2 family protein [Ignavibacteria bacterium]MCU7505152.1 LEA type 2 family protein [Ignavibacteria bacterium]MCU7517995.1 LEA type 2 family protein [Ignavibacteria bacterium]
MKPLKYIAIVIGIAAIIAAGAYLGIKLTHSEKPLADRFLPKLRKAEVQVVDLKSEEAEVNINAYIYNPAPLGISIDSLSYTVLLEGNEISESRYSKPLHIEASRTSEVSLPISVEFKKLIKIMKEMEQAKKDSGNFQINAVVFLNSKLIPQKRFDLALSQKMPMMYFPDMKVKGVKLDKIRLNGGTIVVDLEIKNKNTFNISFKNLSYQVKIEDNDWIKGSRDGVVELPAKQAAMVSIPLEVNIGTMGKGLIGMLLKGGDMRYQMKMKANIVSGNKTIQNSKLEMKASGNMKSLKEAVSKNG